LAGPGLVKALAGLLSIQEAYLTAPAGRRLEPAMMRASVIASGSVHEREAAPAFNVLGSLEGSDAHLKNEYVVFSAHYDHLETSPSGEIFNGADDDASGTAAVLEIAQALSIGPRPKRSTLIVFHTAEELGLFGSEFNTDHEPAVPLDRLVANFNIDMIGRSRADGNTDRRDRELTDSNSVYVIGADKLSTELHLLSEQTNAETEKFRFDYTYNSEEHPSQFYYRSDHYNYAKNGIPVIFYFTGPHRDYHEPTDDVDKLDFEKMARITRLILATGWRVANRSKRLVVDKYPAMK
jgi:Zn-dependent M28 family amino/carboxypeptidase